MNVALAHILGHAIRNKIFHINSNCSILFMSFICQRHIVEVGQDQPDF